MRRCVSNVLGGVLRRELLNCVRRPVGGLRVSTLGTGARRAGLTVRVRPVAVSLRTRSMSTKAVGDAGWALHQKCEDPKEQGMKLLEDLAEKIDMASLSKEERKRLFGDPGRYNAGILNTLRLLYCPEEEHPAHIMAALFLYTNKVDSAMFKTGMKLANEEYSEISGIEYREFLVGLGDAFICRHFCRPLDDGDNILDRIEVDPVLFCLVKKMEQAFPKMPHNKMLCALLKGQKNATEVLVPEHEASPFSSLDSVKKYLKALRQTETVMRRYRSDESGVLPGKVIETAYLANVGHPNIKIKGHLKIEVCLEWLIRIEYPGASFLLADPDWHGYVWTLFPWLENIKEPPKLGYDEKKLESAYKFLENKREGASTGEQKKFYKWAEDQLDRYRKKIYGF